MGATYVPHFGGVEHLPYDLPIFRLRAFTTPGVGMFVCGTDSCLSSYAGAQAVIIFGHMITPGGRVAFYSYNGDRVIYPQFISVYLLHFL